MTAEQIVQAYTLKAQMIADAYYEKFSKEVKDKSHENTFSFLIDNEKDISRALTDDIVQTLHETGSAALLMKLRDISQRIAFSLTTKIQAEIKQ